MATWVTTVAARDHRPGSPNANATGTRTTPTPSAMDRAVLATPAAARVLVADDAPGLDDEVGHEVGEHEPGDRQDRVGCHGQLPCPAGADATPVRLRCAVRLRRAVGERPCERVREPSDRAHVGPVSGHGHGRPRDVQRDRGLGPAQALDEEQPGDDPLPIRQVVEQLGEERRDVVEQGVRRRDRRSRRRARRAGRTPRRAARGPAGRPGRSAASPARAPDRPRPRRRPSASAGRPGGGRPAARPRTGRRRGGAGPGARRPG